tara:strand:+ start:1020 stop:1442 length:423 start_codon:yes stop_codon:yes gene_type:complete
MAIIKHYAIREPIWNGSAKKRQIGLAINRMQGVDELRVDITKTNKHKERIYPDTYLFTPKFFHNYEGEIVSKYGTQIKLFFIEDLPLVDNLTEQERIFYKEASKYGKFNRFTEIKNNNEGAISAKSNTGNTKHKPTRTKI